MQTHLCSEVLLEVREGKGQDELPTVLHWDNFYARLHTHSAAHRARAHITECGKSRVHEGALDAPHGASGEVLVTINNM